MTYEAILEINLDDFLKWIIKMLTAILVPICSNCKLQKETAYLELMRLWMMTMAVIESPCPFPNLHNSIQFYLHLELQTCNICFTVYSVSDRSL